MNKESITAFFREKSGKPLSFREIAELMGLSRPEGRALKRVLREMLRSGEVIRTRKGLYGPAEDMNLTTGYFEAHRDGFGFVISDKPGERDIFIPPGLGLGAMNGDRVIARIENWKRRGGRIIRILERVYTRVFGKVDAGKSVTYVRPKSKAIPFDLYIAPKDKGKAVHGDNVIAEIISYPTDKRPPSGRIVKIVEKPVDPASEVEAIIDEFNLPRKFPKSVTDEAKLLSENRQAALSVMQSGQRTAKAIKRHDLRELPTVTIDGERARDFDDAVSVSPTEHGYRLWVHIADVGFYVPWGSALDLEARKRGTSVYFPDRVIPMLPRELSEDLCSLRPDVERYAFTVEMDIDRHGRRRDVRFYPSLIKSDERMTYTSVRKILVDKDPGEGRKYSYLLRDFELMGELCDILRSNRLRRGSLDFDLPEPEILLDLQGNPEAIIRAERNFAHMIIEEFMIAANEAIAEYLQGNNVPSLYRIHEEPDPVKLEEVLQVIKPLGKILRKGLRPKDFSDLLKAIKGREEEEVINYVVLRSLKQARYSSVNVGHFGLASDSYTHFTSPIRRYPDLVVHRILREVLSQKHIADKRTKELGSMLPDIAFSSSRLERLSDAAERQVVDAMRAWFMKDKVGSEFDARVVGVTAFGMKVRLKEFYIEGFMHLSYMTDDFYQFNDNNMSLYGRNKKRSFRIGQELRVRVDRIDMEEREVIFGLV
ncbi:MAG TPA: ribonuclease R [Candidatus Sulfobium mesophilum]|nr:ribonuclease R [Candidatus Sulfobium mesophilum]